MNFYSSQFKNCLFTINKEEHQNSNFVETLRKHPEIQFVSLVAVDFSGNGTDEKIPIELFLKESEQLLHHGVQTDGSSVHLPGIATLDNAKVILLPDLEAQWHVDYNFRNLNEVGLPIGTLCIPSFLMHDNQYVCSRSILKRASQFLKQTSLDFVKLHPTFIEEIGVKNADKVVDIVLTSATELEFWVQTPEDQADLEQLSKSQRLKEQYWKRTDGDVRSALEDCIYLMTLYGFEPEMGHKEVGGVTSPISTSGMSSHIMEQLEIDWKFADEMTNCDRECFIRHLIKDVFHLHKLEVTFRAKPLENVAGSGKHTHIGVGANLKNGCFVNLMSPIDLDKQYTTSYGLSALMGILKNYEIINPFVTWTNDAINRLKPHFEAPICIVSALGESPSKTSRNRSILIGLIKDLQNPKATRFELRSPSPHNNTYLILAACYQAMVDGLIGAGLKLNLDQLVSEFSKQADEPGHYLETGRQYRSELNVFEAYDEATRHQIFGNPVYTVVESLAQFEKYPDKTATLYRGEVFTEAIVHSYQVAILDKWCNQFIYNVSNEMRDLVRACERLNHSDLLDELWNEIQQLRNEIMGYQQGLLNKALVYLSNQNYEQASQVQLQLQHKSNQLKELYKVYKNNVY